MLKQLGFFKGVNLGGWFSQCDYSEERLNTFITETDFAQINAWGFDHVRIPIDYNVIQNEDGSMKEDGLRRIDGALALCDKYGLTTGVALPGPHPAVPIVQILLTFFIVSGSRSIALAIFVAGPIAMISTSFGFAFTVSRIKSIAF